MAVLNQASGAVRPELSKKETHMKLVYFSVTSNEIPNLSEACRLFAVNTQITLDIYARTRTQLRDNPEAQADFIRKALEADALVVTLMAGQKSFPAWENLVSALEQRRAKGAPCPYFHVQPTGSNAESLELVEAVSDGVTQGHWNTLGKYYRYGGVENLLYMLCFLARLSCGSDIPRGNPEKLPNQGLYHPDHGYIRDKAAWTAGLNPARPTVGIWFYQNFWSTNNRAHIDAVIRELEMKGANVICAFHTRFKDRLLGNKGADDAAREFFMDKGRVLIDVLLNPVMFSLKTASPDYKDLLSTLNVPVIQMLSTSRSVAEWEESDQGLTQVDITISVAQPEMDGVIIGMTSAAKQTVGIDPLTGAAVNKYVPIPERISRLVRLALSWAALGRLSNREKKIAVVFHHYPPRNDRIGCAAGLDSFAGVAALVRRMADVGYLVDHGYEDGDDLAANLLSCMTCDRRWLLPEQMAERAKASAGPEDYQPWHDALPEPARKKMTGDWGAMPGDLFVYQDRISFPGLVNGNLFLTIQPPRGYFEQIEKLTHDMHLSPPHHYLAHYRWIQEVFGAHAIIHVGKHGSLEWLPGKAVGLGPHCYPDLAIGDLPNFYPYIINDPGEGTQAKRRASACIIDHLPPAQTSAGLYDEMAVLDNLLDEYRDARTQDPGKLPLLREMMVKAAQRADILKELELAPDEALAAGEAFTGTLHHYLEEIRDTAVADGLHVLGQPPEGPGLVSTLAQMTRLANGPVPSLRKGVMRALGLDKDADPLSKGACRAREICERMIEDLLSALPSGSVPETPEEGPETVLKAIMQRHLGSCPEDVKETLLYVASDLLPRIARTTDEIDLLLGGLEGRFVPEGPSGAPTRGQADILPTGRNFFSVDPQKIPTKAAWEVGRKLADALIAKYRGTHGGCYPENVGIILWASPTMRSKGDDVSQILYLLGVEPLWQKGSGNVTGVRIIPSEILGRPRIDVTPRISGIFRDAFPLLTDLIDSAVQMVALLDEPLETNFIRRHVAADRAELEKSGMDEEAAFRQATFRIFGAPPGSYGTGVAQMIESGTWQTTDDLGNLYVQWSSYAYGKNTFGTEAPGQFRRSLGRMSVTVKNEDTREKDMMSCTDFYAYHGGLITAVHAVQGRRPFSVAGDSNDPDDVKVRTTQEEARHIFRARLLNPVWLEGLKRHGYKGAGDISKAMDIILGWDATAGVVDDFMYRRFARKVALDKEMQDWMTSVNPYALHNILNKLLEAAARGMWDADGETLEELRQAFLEIEGEIEEVTE